MNKHTDEIDKGKEWGKKIKEDKFNKISSQNNFIK